MVGIGETGLDYFYDHSPRQVQREVFTRFLSLATALKRPVICLVASILIVLVGVSTRSPCASCPALVSFQRPACD